MPQFLPCIAQVTGLHPHLLSTPPPPHVFGVVHEPGHVMILPHPSETVPHSAPRSAHVFGMHGVEPQRFGPSPPQMSGIVQVLQSIMPPQPSGSMPQLAFSAAHVVGVQPHLFGVPPPPHVLPESRHAPQSIILPQPSETMPQSAPRSGQVNGVQPHIFDMPPPPQVSGGVQRPHCTVAPHPSDTSPQLAPSSPQVRTWHGSSPHLLRPAPPQTPTSQPPQSSTLSHPSGTLPHSACSSSHVRGMHVGPSVEASRSIVPPEPVVVLVVLELVELVPAELPPAPADVTR
jgi:hypothetical protein